MKGNFKIFITGILIGTILFLIAVVFSVIAKGTLVFNMDLWKELGIYIMYSVPLTFVNGVLGYRKGHSQRRCYGVVQFYLILSLYRTTNFDVR